MIETLLTVQRNCTSYCMHIVKTSAKSSIYCNLTFPLAEYEGLRLKPP